MRINNKRRIFAVMILFGALFFALVIRLGYLQISQASWLQEKAVGQWTRSTTVAAKRGKITDQNGIVLAQSGSADTVVVTPANVTDPEKMAQTISEVLGMDYQNVYDKVTQDKSSVIVKRQITSEQADQLRAANLKGLGFTVDTRRYYPLKNFLTQVIGYTTVDGTGQDGIEARYDKYLAGTPGKLIAERDSSGREIPYGAEQYVEAQDGYNVKLTVDAVVQTFLENALQDAYEVNQAKTAQGIVMDPKTGEILAIGTYPSFDLNNPPRNDYDQLQTLSRNRVVSDSFEPGSTFKIITLSSALDSGAVTKDSTFYCPGYKIVDGERIKCWSSRSHGSETLAKGVQNSCNPVFMELALRMGKETFYEYIYNFGFGESTDAGMTGEAGGIVRHVKYVQNCDLARIGFGQSVSVTAIQLANAVCAAINGGELMQPYIVKEIYSDDGAIVQENEPTVIRRVIKEETSAIVREMLEGVVEEGGGKNCYIPGYRIGGKTGTAQKYENGVIAQGKNIASFIGFAPVEDPQFLVYILVDEPKVGPIFGSTVAAPFVRNVMQDLLKYYGIQPNYGEDEGQGNAEVPDVTGKNVDAAKSALSEAGFKSSTSGTGEVVAQIPQAGASVPKGTQVQLYSAESDEALPDDTQEVAVPDLIGKTAEKAYEELKKLGLSIKASGAPKGVIVSQNPSAGKKVLSGTSVAIVLKEKDES